MFDYTRAALTKVVADLKRIAYVFSVTVQLIGIGYLVYAVALRVGIMWTNLLLLGLSVCYFVFFLITYSKKEKKIAKVKRTTAKTYKWIKLTVKAYTLGVAVYGVYIATEHFTPISALFMTASALGWICQVAIELLVSYAEGKVGLIIEGIEADIQNITEPVTKTVNFVKRITGGEVTEEREEPSKKRLMLDKMVTEEREKREKIKEEKKAAQAQEKIRAAEEKREKRTAKINKVKGDIVRTLRIKKTPALKAPGNEDSHEKEEKKEPSMKA